MRKGKFLLVLFFVVLSGCSNLKEALRGFLGTSTKILEDGRKEAVVREFRVDFPTCHSKIKKILKEKGCYLYREDLQNNLLAFYLSEEDTTPVGIFLSALDTDKTRVEISSPSSYAKNLVAKFIVVG